MTVTCMRLDSPVFAISGVATFVRDTATPCQAEDGLATEHLSVQDGRIRCCTNMDSDFTADELAKLDSEGRCVITEHQITLVFPVCTCE